jgi:hypothetical protein
VLGIVRIARLAGREVGALGGDRLAENHRARRPQAFHRGCVLARRAALVQHRAVLGRHVAGVEDVLHAHRHPVQRPDRLARALALVGGARLRQRVLLVQERPGLDLRLERADALEAGLHQLFRRQPAFSDFARGVGRG